MHAYIDTYIHYTHIHTYIHTYIHAYLLPLLQPQRQRGNRPEVHFLYIYIYIYTHICIYVYICIYLYIYIYKTKSDCICTGAVRCFAEARPGRPRWWAARARAQGVCVRVRVRSYVPMCPHIYIAAACRPPMGETPAFSYI